MRAQLPQAIAQGHNALLARAQSALLLTGTYSNRQLSQQVAALQGHGAHDAALLTQAAVQWADASPDRLHSWLDLSPACTSLLQQLWHMNEDNDYTQATQLLAHMQAQAALLDSTEQLLVQGVCAVAAHSAQYWLQVEAPTDSTKPMSARKLRWRRLMKADAYGMLKGMLFGSFFFGASGIFLKVSVSTGALGALGIFVFFTAFESIRYAHKLSSGKVKLEDDPWWGPQETKPF